MVRFHGGPCCSGFVSPTCMPVGRIDQVVGMWVGLQGLERLGAL